MPTMEVPDRESENNTETFEFDTSDSVTPDIWVKETFTNRFGDEKAVLAGDSYGVLVEGGVKADLDWDTTHHDFDDRRKEWTVDVDGLEHLAEVANEAGFTVQISTGMGINEESPLFDAVEAADEGDQISVEYQQKNGNGTNTKSGIVQQSRIANDTPVIVFVRDDGQTMRVKPDQHGDPSLFTGGYHPFVGNVTLLDIEN